MCRDSHPTWKGVNCTQCSAFFCFRGLHRHFDVDLIPFLRKIEPWVCPKCSQCCNCRCCHFARPYSSRDKPVRARIKPIDPRGRVMGFTDNVFDQKRGKRASMVVHSASPQPEIVSRGQKRSRTQINDEKVELQQPPQQQRDYYTFTSFGAAHTRRSDANSYYHPYASSPRSLGPKGQLRISDLVEEHSPANSGPHFQAPFRRGSPPASLTPEDGPFRRHSEEASIPPLTDEASIVVLEKRLEALRRYADDLLDLSLVESHAKLLEKLRQLQDQVEERKRRKAEALFDNLNRDFPELATLAREEARRQGL